MSFINAIIPFVGILVFLIVVHELGHFITAKLAGVKVLEAGLGYPPKAWGKKIGETEYTINWLPLGGFVRLLGEEDPSDPRSLAAKPAWVRLTVLFAGSAMNFMLPIVLFAIAFTVPQEVNTGGVTINTIAPDSPADEAGLEPEDVILTVAGRDIENIDDLSRAIQVNRGEDIDFRVLRPSTGEVREETVFARWHIPEGQGPTGISIRQYPFTRTRAEPPWESIPHAWQYTLDTLMLAEKQFEGWFRGADSPEFSGPVGIADATGEVVEEAGWIPPLRVRRAPVDQSRHPQHPASAHARRRSDGLRHPRGPSRRKAHPAREGGPGPPRRLRPDDGRGRRHQLLRYPAAHQWRFIVPLALY